MPRTIHRSFFVAGAVVLGASAAQGQITAVFCNIQGVSTSQVPGFPGFTFTPGANIPDVFRRPYSSQNGTFWVITARASSALGGPFRLVIVGGGTPTPVVVARQGAATPFDAARTWSEFDEQVTVNENGRLAFAASISGNSADNIVVAQYNVDQFVNLPFREGRQVPTIAGATFGPTLDSAAISESGTIACRSLITGGGSNTTNNQILALPTAIIARTGFTSPIGLTAKWENFDLGTFFYRSNGAYLIRGDLDSATNADEILGFANLVTVREGSVIAGLNSPVTFRGIQGVAFGQDPSYLARGQNTLASEDWVVRNGALVARANGLITPNSPTAERFVSSTAAVPTFFAVGANGAGDYLVGGFTNVGIAGRDEVLVWNGDRVAIREGDRIDINADGNLDNVFVGSIRTDACIVKAGRSGVVYATVEVKDSRGNVIGYAYVCTPVTSTCTGDFNGDGFVDGFDYDDFVNCFEVPANCPSGVSADINGDGFVDGFDYDDFVLAFELGC